MNQGLARLEQFGEPGGIDQSKNPGPNTVRDARNLDSSGSYWTVRPGWQKVAALYGNLSTNYPILDVFEFIPDKRYEYTRGYEVVAIGHAWSSAQTRYQKVDARGNAGDGFITDLPYVNTKIRHASALLRYTETDGAVKYTPGVVITNGIGNPQAYQQSFYYYGYDFIQLTAQDGGDTDISYLPEVPKGKIVVQYKSRLFMLNTPDGGNRIYWTTADSNGVFTANVWPSGYNMDLGGPEEITAAIEFNGSLVIFKEREIWLLGGDGVGGMWQVQKIDNQHGAISQECVVNVGDSLVFMGRDGIYRWAGGQAMRVSHPKIQNLWNTLILTERYDGFDASGYSTAKFNQAIYDPNRRRVIFYVSTDTSSVNAGYVVYNLEKNTWDVWNMLPDNLAGFSPGDAKCPSRIFAAQGWTKNKTEIMGFTGDTRLYIMRPGQAVDRHMADGISVDGYIAWYLRTPDYFLNDSDEKLLRQIVVDIADTGSWFMTIVPLLKNGNPMETLYRNATHNILIDSNASVVNHTCMGNCNFAVGDEVDVYYMPTLYKLISTTVVAVSGEYLYTNDPYTSYAGLVAVLPKNAANRNVKVMTLAGSCSLFGTAKWGDNAFTDAEVKRVTIPMNLIGRQFSLYLSNMGMIKGLAAPGNLKLGGWGMWAKPRRTLRAGPGFASSGGVPPEYQTPTYQGP